MGALYFSANDRTHGYELWRSDGTEAGTVIVKDIYPGRDWSEPASLTDVGDTLYFDAYDGIHGHELWTSDGTAAGTVMVKDIYPGKDWTPPIDLTDVEGTRTSLPTTSPTAMSCGRATGPRAERSW